MSVIHKFLVILITLIWGFNFVVIKWGIESIDPITMTTLRFFFTAIPLIFFIKKPAVPLFSVALYGVLFGIGLWGVVNMAITLGMTAGMASLLLQTSAFLSVIAGYVFFGESISHIKKLGILFAFVGFCILVLSHDQSIPKLSLFLMFIAALFWTMCNTIIKIKKPDNVISFIAWSSLFVPIPVILISLIYHYVYFAEVSWINLMQIPDLKGWSSILFQSFITTLIGYGIWTMLINKNGLSSVAPYSLLVPLFGLFFGWLIYHEQLVPNEIIGSLFVIIGLVFLSINFKKTILK